MTDANVRTSRDVQIESYVVDRARVEVRFKFRDGRTVTFKAKSQGWHPYFREFRLERPGLCEASCTKTGDDHPPMMLHPEGPTLAEVARYWHAAADYGKGLCNAGIDPEAAKLTAEVALAELPHVLEQEPHMIEFTDEVDN